MTKVLAWLRKVPVLGWLVLALVVGALVVWRLLVRAWNAERRLALSVQLSNNRRRFEAVAHQSGLKAAEDRAKAQAVFDRRKAALDARKAAIETAKPAPLADAINRAFGGG